MLAWRARFWHWPVAAVTVEDCPSVVPWMACTEIWYSVPGTRPVENAHLHEIREQTGPYSLCSSVLNKSNKSLLWFSILRQEKVFSDKLVLRINSMCSFCFFFVLFFNPHAFTHMLHVHCPIQLWTGFRNMTCLATYPGYESCENLIFLFCSIIKKSKIISIV